MRFTGAIVLSLLIHLGLFARVAGDGLCCPDRSLEHIHMHGAHDHGPDGTGHDHDDCGDDHGFPAGDDCPSDCGEHHHHHGTCLHHMQISLAGDGCFRLAAPNAVSLGCERHHLRAPDGPVMEMDKPPLIRASA